MVTDGFEGRLQAVGALRFEKFVALPFLGKALHDTDGGERLLSQRSQQARAEASLACRHFDSRGISQYNDEQKRRYRERGQRKTPVQPQHYRDHAEQQATVAAEDDDAASKHILDSGRVRSQACDQITQRLAIMEAQREALQMCKEMAAQVESEALSNVTQGSGEKVCEDSRSQRDQEGRRACAPKNLHGRVGRRVQPGVKKWYAARLVREDAINDHL